MTNKTLVSASEIGEYVYCKRCWWKHLHGFVRTTHQMILGKKFHSQAYDQINSWQSTKETIKFISLIIFFLFIIFLILKIFIFKNI